MPRFSELPALAKKALRLLRYYIRGLRNYWKYTRVPKEKDLWVFSGFRHACYMDNTKYFYEYLLARHPEIRAVWLTTDDGVYKRLSSQGKPVLRMDSPQGTDCMSRAAVAVTDHFVMTDFSPEYGLNDGTRIVQLWHGVGFKAMGDEKGVKNTTERGVRYSRDLLPAPGDGKMCRIIKKIKYRFCAPFREKMETYFVMTDPGPEREDTIFRFWGVPREARVRVGNPRTAPLLSVPKAVSPAMVLYAPTYRFDAPHEKALVDLFLSKVPAIQRQMEASDALFVLRLHPHTWRDYGAFIRAGLEGYSRVEWRQDADIYETLGQYSVLITDYSSIAMDFVGGERPVIFFCPDYDWFARNEAGFTLNFRARAPGDITDSWAETLSLTAAYLRDPALGMEERFDKSLYFYDPAVNDGRDCERIAAFIKSRLEESR